MSVIGIAGEYNPFHYGHLHHIKATKEQLGEDCPVVCVMSGDFIQRGEAAVYSKFARAEAAVRSGVDLVIELPLPWTLSSAEGFARGTVGLLGASGVVTHMSFGSECGELAELEALAELLLRPDLGTLIRGELDADEGIPFALARQRAAEKLIGAPARLLEAPNNILAVEYIKQIYGQRLAIEPVTVRRIGAGHDGTAASGPRSASELRRALAAGLTISGSVPPEAYEVYHREDEYGRGPVGQERLETAALARLRMLREQAFSELPDSGEGLSNRLMRAAKTEPTLDAVLAASKSKRYALSRIRRMTMCAVLGVTARDALDTPPYIRVLAANGRGCALLHDMNSRSRVPVITKPASVRTLDGECRRIFALGSDAHDFFALGCTAREERRGGADMRTSPVIIRDDGIQFRK